MTTYEKYDQAMANHLALFPVHNGGKLTSKRIRRRKYWQKQIQKQVRRLDMSKPWHSIAPRYRKLRRLYAMLATVWMRRRDLMEFYTKQIDKIYEHAN